MRERPRPQLRDNAQDIAVIELEGSARPMLGTRSPEEQDRRRKVVQQWGQAPSPRVRPQAAIEQPLDQRMQTVLSYEVGTSLRSRLNGGLGPLAQRRHTGPEPSAVRLLHGTSEEG